MDDNNRKKIEALKLLGRQMVKYDEDGKLVVDRMGEDMDPEIFRKAQENRDARAKAIKDQIDDGTYLDDVLEMKRKVRDMYQEDKTDEELEQEAESRLYRDQLKQGMFPMNPALKRLKK